MIAPVYPRLPRHRSSSGRFRGRAFTLIEIMAVMVILMLLGTLLLVGLHRARVASIAIKCLSQEKSIGAAVKAYASDWNGWTHPDGQHYPILLGYPAYDPNHPRAFDKNLAKSVSDFRCPLDKSPKDSTGTGGYVTPGYLRSYNLASAFQGMNLGSVDSPRVVMLHELNKPRHPNGTKTGTVYLFADLSAKVTAGTINDAEFYPGLMSNWFANVTLGRRGIVTIGLPHLVMVWSEDLARDQSDRLDFLPTIPPNWDLKSGKNEPDWVMGKWSGYLDFPAPGDWTITIECDDVGGVWVDENRDDILDWSEGTQQGTRQKGDGTGPNWWIRPVDHRFTLKESGRHRVFFYFFEWKGTQSFRFSWRNSDAGIHKTIIPVERMWHNPFGNLTAFLQPLIFVPESREQ